jgi:hypothetical protein
MLQPTAVVNSILDSIRSISQLATELGAPTIPPTQSIVGHYFYSGAENCILRAVEQMESPSMLLAYLDRTFGNFDGMTVWKHRLTLYARARNAASNGSAMSAPDLINLALNYPISVPVAAANIRYVDLLNNSMWFFSDNERSIADTLGQDLWSTTMVWNEYGDAGAGVTTSVNLCVPPSTVMQVQEAIEKLIAQRDAVIALLGDDDETLIEKVNVAYQTMIDEERT